MYDSHKRYTVLRCLDVIQMTESNQGQHVACFGQGRVDASAKTETGSELGGTPESNSNHRIYPDTRGCTVLVQFPTMFTVLVPVCRLSLPSQEGGEGGRCARFTVTVRLFCLYRSTSTSPTSKTIILN